MLSLFAAILASRASAVSFEVRYQPIANLTYELDVLTGVLPHDGDQNFKKLWNDHFLSTEEDRQALQHWKLIRTNLSERNEPQQKSSTRFPIEWVGPRLNPDSDVRFAGFDAKDATDYHRRLQASSGAAMAYQLSQVVEHFLPKYQEWWSQEGSQRGKSFAQKLGELLKSDPIQNIISEETRFYRPRLKSNSVIPFILLYRPDDLPEPTSGQQLGPYSVLQFLPNEKPELRVDIAVHELSHFLYNSASPRDLAGLQNRFLRVNSSNAMPCYNLLNEVLATAIGNGILKEKLSDPVYFSRYLAYPKSMYNDEAIDSGAKAVWEWLKSYFGEGGSLYDPQFVSKYVARMEKGMGSQLGRPKLELIRLFAAIDTRIEEIPGTSIRKALRCASMSRTTTDFANRKDLDEYLSNPNLSGIFVVSPDRLSRLGAMKIVSTADCSAILGRVGGHEPVLFAFRRNQNAIGYVVATNDSSQVDAVLKRIATLEKFSPGLVD